MIEASLIDQYMQDMKLSTEVIADLILEVESLQNQITCLKKQLEDAQMENR